MELKKVFLGRRVIAFNISDDSLASWLETMGSDDYEIYLDKKKVTADKNKLLSRRLYEYEDAKSVKAADGDILLLEAQAVRHIKKYQLVKKFERAYLQIRWTDSLFLIFHLLRFFLSGIRVYPSHRPLVRINKQWWLHLVVRKTARKRKKGVARIYMHKNWSVEDLFRNLKDNNINYVVLRGWSKLSTISTSSDIDILVSDKDHDYFINQVDAGKKGEQALDVYSVTGNKHSSAEVPYYEPDKAREILQNTLVGPCGCFIPAPKQAFMSFVYHVLYHKGFNAGVASKYNNAISNNKFTTVIKQQMEELAINVPLTMEALDEYLGLHGWRPPADKLARIAIRNNWVQLYFFGENGYFYNQGKYIGAFVLRKDCIQHQATDFVLKQIEQAGFEIVKVIDIEPEKIIKFSEKMRGGNWENDLFPEILIIVSDNKPIIVTADERKKINYKFVDNSRMLCKLEIRKKLDKKYKIKTGAWLHGCDNITESKEYIYEIAPDLADRLYK